MRVNVLPPILLAIALALSACTDRAGPRKPKHKFSAPHGGTIVRLGKEEFHLELVRDAAAGKLTAYVLDAESVHPVPARSSSFELTATVGGQKHVLEFRPAAEPSAGNAAGSSGSRFEAQAEWLKSTASFAAELSALKIESITFLRTPFNFPKGNERP